MEIDHFALKAKTIRELKDKVIQENKAMTINSIALNKEKLAYMRQLNQVRQKSYLLIKRFKV